MSKARNMARLIVDETGGMDPNVVSDRSNTSTGGFDLPAGSTAQRPASPIEGYVRLNTDSDTVEYYDGENWNTVNITYNVEYLVIAGGGCAGTNGGAGGGAGGYRCSVFGEMSGGGATAETPLAVSKGSSVTVIVGAGSAVANPGQFFAGAGSNSSLGTVVSAGGGGGGNGGVPAYLGGPGGSGGGGAAYGSYTPYSGGSGTSGQGYAGGNGNSGGNNWFASAGGGGAGAVGQSSSSNMGGVGGAGVASSITGTSVTRAAGGSGYQQSTATTGSNGANSGGGGSFATGGNANNAGNSGVVILRYPGAQRGTGGTVTSSGGYTIHTFTSSGTYSA